MNRPLRAALAVAALLASCASAPAHAEIRSGDVRPSLAKPDQIDGVLGNVEASPDGRVAVAGHEHLADSRNVSGREFRSAVALALSDSGTATGDVGVSERSAALRLHVRHVVSVSAQEEVAGVHASGDVAAMKDEQAIRDGAVGQLPRYAGSAKIASSDTRAVRNDAVAVAVVPAHPQPALGVSAASDLGPEAIRESHAGEPTTAEGQPRSAGAFDWRAWSWAGAIRTARGDFKPIIGARFSIKASLPAGINLGARIDASRQQDGGGGVELADPATFQTAEAYVGLHRDIVAGLGLSAIYGIAVPFEGGRAQALERYPQTLAGAVRFSSPGVTAYAGAGKHDAAGPGVKAILSAQVNTGGPTATVVEVVQPGGFVRVLALLSLK